MLPIGLNETGSKTYATIAPRWAAVITWLDADPSRAALRRTLDPQITHWRDIDHGEWLTDGSDLIGAAEDLQLVEMYAADQGYVVPGAHLAVPDPVAVNANEPEKLQSVDDWARSHPVVNAATNPASAHVPTADDWKRELQHDAGEIVPWWVWALGGGALLSAAAAFYFGGRAAAKYGPALAPALARVAQYAA